MAPPGGKYLPIKTFRDRGYLHEVNRLLLHPLGLALEAKLVKEAGATVSFTRDDFDEIRRDLVTVRELLPADAIAERKTLEKLLGSFEQYATRLDVGEMFLSGVWDCQDDEEGVLYGDDLLDGDKAAAVCTELLERRLGRQKHTGGFIVQPLPDHQVLSTAYTDPSLRDRGHVVSDGAPQFGGVETPEPDEE